VAGVRVSGRQGRPATAMMAMRGGCTSPSPSSLAYLAGAHKSISRARHPDNVGNRMHLDLQKGAFGASFSAKRLNQLQRELLDNANLATGLEVRGP